MQLLFIMSLQKKTFNKDIRHIISYGLILAVLAFSLKWLQWKFLIIENAIDIYIGLIAVFFTALGIWVAMQLVKPKVKTVVFEKEVPEKFSFNENELIKLNLSSCYFLFLPDFMDKYTEYVLRHASPAELETKTQTMQDLKTMYKNPLFVILFTYAEILPVGLIVSLISSFILKKKEQ